MNRNFISLFTKFLYAVFVEGHPLTKNLKESNFLIQMDDLLFCSLAAFKNETELVLYFATILGNFFTGPYFTALLILVVMKRSIGP